MSLTVPLYGFGSGGAGLNFEVKDYRTEAELQAAGGKENRIGVITSIPMTGWRFDANQPEDLQEGEIWFSVGASSVAEFNALKKNAVQIYPVLASQYVGGALVNVTAKSYQGGKWTDWFTYLYNAGDECVDITGGWVAKALKWDSSVSTAKAPTLEKNETEMVISQSVSDGSGLVHTANKIDVSGYKAIHFRGKMYNTGGGTNANTMARFRLYSTFGSYVNQNSVALVGANGSEETQTFTIDLTGISTTEVYVAFQVYKSSSHITVERVWLER